MPDQLSADLASLRLPRDENPDKGRARWVLLAAVLLLVGTLAAYVFAYPIVEARLFRTEVGFTEVLLVSPAQGSTELTATGYVTPQIISRVAAKVPGRIARVLVKEGEHVSEGAVLMQLDDVEQRAMIAAAHMRVLSGRARAQSARANLVEVQTQLGRSERLVAGGSMAKANVEDLKARLYALDEAAKAATAEVKVADADLQTATVNLDYLTVRAPIAGTIVAKPPAAGEPAGPNGTPIEIADFSTLQVETDVPEGRLNVVKLGGPCEVSMDAFPGRRYRGEVAQLGQRVNRQKASVTVKVKLIDPADGVLPDMAARVSFLSRPLDAQAIKEQAKVVVPAAAVAERGGGKVVFVADSSGAVRVTPVTLGPAAQGGFELVAGPPPGTRVVSHPPAALADGGSVKEKKD